MTNITHLQAKEAEARITGEKFCSTCQKYRAAEGGRIKVSGSHSRPVKRWQCAACVERLQKLGGGK